jgi:hypothetical protein
MTGLCPAPPIFIIGIKAPIETARRVILLILLIHIWVRFHPRPTLLAGMPDANSREVSWNRSFGGAVPPRPGRAVRDKPGTTSETWGQW